MNAVVCCVLSEATHSLELFNAILNINNIAFMILMIFQNSQIPSYSFPIIKSSWNLSRNLVGR